MRRYFRVKPDARYIYSYIPLMLFCSPEIQCGSDSSPSPADCGGKPCSVEDGSYLGSVRLSFYPFNISNPAESLITMNVHFFLLPLKFLAVLQR